MIDITELQRLLSALGGHLSAVTVSVAVGAGLLATVTAMATRALRGKNLNAKSSIGFGAVQAGVAYITITGVYEFFNRLLSMPVPESWLLAGFIEAAIWAAVGWIYTFGKGTDKNGKPNEGFGPAGPFFWVTVIGGGTLAILGSKTSPIAVGRIVIVVIGAYMWYLRLLQVTRRSGKPSRWKWTPKRLLLAVGAIEPADEDVENEAREWQIRRLARAMRWANSCWPWSWLGRRSLIHRGETTQEDVIKDALRRFAVTHLLTTTCNPDSDVMQRLLADVQTAYMAGQADSPEPDRAIRRTPDTGQVPADTPDTSGRVPAARTNGQVPAITGRTVVDIAEVSARRRGSGQGKSADTVSVDDLADTLGKKFGGEYVGTPKALEELRRVYGSCSKDRAIEAKSMHNARREAGTPPTATPSDSKSDDPEERVS